MMKKLVIKKDDFELRGHGDDLRVDRLCRELLRYFYDRLVERGMDPADATGLATGADYFVRDFLVDRMRLSIFHEHRGTVRQFAGNWYIVTTVEPYLGELTGMLAGVKQFYRFLSHEGLVSSPYLAQVEQECDDADYYGHRIESFWRITGDGYTAWEKECSLRSP